MTEAMKLVEQLQHFAMFHGHREISVSLAKSKGSLAHTAVLQDEID